MARTVSGAPVAQAGAAQEARDRTTTRGPLRVSHAPVATRERIRTIILDEYYPMSPDSIHSYQRYMWENLFSQIDIDPANVHIPRGDIPREEVDLYCRRYEDTIERIGGDDF